MIRFRMAELMAEHSFRTGRRVEWREVADATGIHRTTLSKMLNSPAYNATVSNIDLLCRYFGCTVGDLLVYVPDEDAPVLMQATFKGPKAKTAAASAGARARHGKRAAANTEKTQPE